MSVEITTAFVQQYKDNVIHLSQQKGSRLRDTVRSETVKGKFHFFERIGSTAAQLRTSRHADTTLIDTPHSRRRVSLADYEWADLVDNADKVRLLISPQSEYAIAGNNAMKRKIDDLIITAASGNAYVGETGGTTVALPSGQKIVHGGAGLNLTKLISAKKLLDAAEVDPDEPRHIVCSAEQVEDLLGVSEVKSADYNSVKALVTGEINTYMGFNFIRSERLAVDGTPSRLVLAYAKQGLGLAIGEDIITRITERPDKSYSVQVYLCMTMGATRIEDEKVVEIACNE